MSAGKLAAQVAHAAVEARSISTDEAVRQWYLGGHYTKIVLETTADLCLLNHYLTERGFKNKLIIDEGRTEIAPFSPTAIGIEIVDKDDDHVIATLGEFETYANPHWTELAAKVKDRQRSRLKRLRAVW